MSRPEIMDSRLLPTHDELADGTPIAARLIAELEKILSETKEEDKTSLVMSVIAYYVVEMEDENIWMQYRNNCREVVLQVGNRFTEYIPT